MLYFTEAVETAPRNITQTKKTPIRSIALAIMTEKPKKQELRQTHSTATIFTVCVKPQESHMTITTHEQPPRLGRGKHETPNLVMARCRVLSGFFFLSLKL